MRLFTIIIICAFASSAFALDYQSILNGCDEIFLKEAKNGGGVKSLLNRNECHRQAAFLVTTDDIRDLVNILYDQKAIITRKVANDEIAIDEATLEIHRAESDFVTKVNQRTSAQQPIILAPFY